MKTTTRHPFLILLFSVLFTNITAQAILVYNQNPAFANSRDRYLSMADSMNTWHSTTFQETYKAIDYMADLREARERRREFHRQMHLERVRNRFGRYHYYYPANSNGYYNNYDYYNKYGYNSSYYRLPYPGNGVWSVLPLIPGTGWLW
ncbi:hypothetical protein ACX0G7_14760 [Flavitalea antarctica]